MNLISVLFTLVIIGVFLYLVEVFLPLDASIKKVIQVIAFLGVCYYLLQVFGLVHGTGIVLR